MEKGFNSKRGMIKASKIFFSLLVVALGVFLVTVTFAQNSGGGDDPTAGFNIHVSVNNHDHADPNKQFDHYCKLTPPIVATCTLFSEGVSGDTQLTEVEYIITKDQYLELPLRERPNWHNHAVELTPERGEPSCVSLPDGLECGALVGILHGTYGKVISLWDPSDPLPSYPPYPYLVDSPFALGQDLNDDLELDWEVGDESTSSVNILPPCDSNIVGPCEGSGSTGGSDDGDDDNGDGNQCQHDTTINFNARRTGEVLQLNDEDDFDEMRVDFFRGKVTVKNGKVNGNGGLNVRAVTTDGREFISNVRFDPKELLEQDCSTLSWRNSATGTIWERGKGARVVDINHVDVHYDLVNDRIDSIALADDPSVLFEIVDMIDN
jgi:hypothetical protein